MGVERGSRHKRSSTFSGDLDGTPFNALSTADDRTVSVTSSSNISEQDQQRNALSGPHAVGANREALRPEKGSVSPPADSKQPRAKTFGSTGAPSSLLQDRLLLTGAPFRQHYRPEESPEDVCTLEDLNPSIVTLVPDFGFSTSKASKGKSKGKSTKEGSSVTAQNLPNVAASDVPSRRRSPSPLPKLRMNRDEGKEVSPAKLKAPADTDRIPGSHDAADVEGASLDAPIDTLRAATCAAEPEDKRKVASPDKIKSRKSSAQRPRASLLGRESKFQPLPFQNVFGMSVDEMLEIAPITRDRRPDTQTHEQGTGAVGAKESNETTSSPTQGMEGRAKASKRNQESCEETTTKLNASLKNPALRRITQEDRTSTFGSGTFVVEDFLASIVSE